MHSWVCDRISLALMGLPQGDSAAERNMMLHPFCPTSHLPGRLHLHVLCLTDPRNLPDLSSLLRTLWALLGLHHHNHNFVPSWFPQLPPRAASCSSLSVQLPAQQRGNTGSTGAVCGIKGSQQSTPARGNPQQRFRQKDTGKTLQRLLGLQPEALHPASIPNRHGPEKTLHCPPNNFKGTKDVAENKATCPRHNLTSCHTLREGNLY